MARLDLRAVGRLRVGPAGAAAGALVVLSGCGAAQLAPPSTAPAAPVTATVGVYPPATVSASAVALRAARAYTLRRLDAAPAASVAAGWSLLGVVDQGRRVVLQTVASGGCASFAGVVVDEGPTVVTISARTVLKRDPGRVCPDHQVLTSGSVVLSAPLGARRLSQGSTTYPP